MANNNQETFDKVLHHLLKQGKASRRKVDLAPVLHCKKENLSLSCAVGCLIPDNEYNIGLEDKSLLYLERNVPSLKGIDIKFLRELMVVHDGAPWGKEDDEKFKAFVIAAMQKVASNNNLTFTLPQ